MISPELATTSRRSSRSRKPLTKELKAANEEAQSSMEELHSTNEELETAKEELQSGNEELVTLNEQLQKRNTELGYLSDEMSNVLTGVDIPILILGGDRRIRRFTPSAEKLLHLLPGDVGHPIGHIRIAVNLPDLDESISQVIKGMRDVWREVQAADGRWYSVRILPFLTAEHKIDGVLMVFVDVDDLKRSHERSQREQKLITAILNAAKDLLVIVLDREGCILEFNRAAQELTGYSLEEVKGRPFWDLLPIPEERAQVKSGFEEVLRGGTSHGETHWLTKRGQPRLIAWSNTVAVNDGGTVDYVIRTGVDVTEREEAQLQARDSNAAVRSLRKKSDVTLLQHQKELQALTARLLAFKKPATRTWPGNCTTISVRNWPHWAWRFRRYCSPRPGRPRRSPSASMLSALGSTAWRKMFTPCPGGSIPLSLMSLAWKPLSGRNASASRHRWVSVAEFESKGVPASAPGRRLSVPLSRGSGESPKYRQARPGYEGPGRTFRRERTASDSALKTLATVLI